LPLGDLRAAAVERDESLGVHAGDVREYVNLEIEDLPAPGTYLNRGKLDGRRVGSDARGQTGRLSQ
jgi:hypothetical protein